MPIPSIFGRLGYRGIQVIKYVAPNGMVERVFRLKWGKRELHVHWFRW